VPVAVRLGDVLRGDGQLTHPVEGITDLAQKPVLGCENETALPTLLLAAVVRLICASKRRETRAGGVVFRGNDLRSGGQARERLGSKLDDFDKLLALFELIR